MQTITLIFVTLLAVALAACAPLPHKVDAGMDTVAETAALYQDFVHNFDISTIPDGNDQQIVATAMTSVETLLTSVTDLRDPVHLLSVPEQVASANIAIKAAQVVYLKYRPTLPPEKVVDYDKLSADLTIVMSKMTGTVASDQARLAAALARGIAALASAYTR